MLDIFSVVLVPEEGLARSVALDGMQRMLQGVQSYPTRLQVRLESKKCCRVFLSKVSLFSEQ